MSAILLSITIPTSKRRASVLICKKNQHITRLVLCRNVKQKSRYSSARTVIAYDGQKNMGLQRAL